MFYRVSEPWLCEIQRHNDLSFNISECFYTLDSGISTEPDARSDKSEQNSESECDSLLCMTVTECIVLYTHRIQQSSS
jgi:hypothetical protein